MAQEQEQPPQAPPRQIYDGACDALVEDFTITDRIVILPDATSPAEARSMSTRIRIQWGQWLVPDLVAERYRAVVCAVNIEDNSHGVIAQIAEALPTSQWTEAAITARARQHVQPHKGAVVKYDMDTLEVLALLRPSEHDHLTLDDLSEGFQLVSEMVRRKPQQRLPIATVCFLAAHANLLVDEEGREPTLETVLYTMYQAGFRGDVYPATWMWGADTAGVFARYPFPDALERIREGGF